LSETEQAKPGTYPNSPWPQAGMKDKLGVLRAKNGD
jgi:hypothetical protein